MEIQDIIVEYYGGVFADEVSKIFKEEEAGARAYVKQWKPEYIQTARGLAGEYIWEGRPIEEMPPQEAMARKSLWQEVEQGTFDNEVFVPESRPVVERVGGVVKGAWQQRLAESDARMSKEEREEEMMAADMALDVAEFEQSEEELGLNAEIEDQGVFSPW